MVVVGDYEDELTLSIVGFTGRDGIEPARTQVGVGAGATIDAPVLGAVGVRIGAGCLKEGARRFDSAIAELVRLLTILKELVGQRARFDGNTVPVCVTNDRVRVNRFERS